MAHVTSKSYYNLQKRLDSCAQGAPASKTLYKILEIMFTEEEAKLVSVLPINFFTVDDAVRRWKRPKKEVKKILDNLADKGIIMDMKQGRTQAYLLAPTMAGFFEFSLMRTDGKFDRKTLSELFYKYINKEDDFFRKLFTMKPHAGRALVQEKSLKKDDIVEVLDYERATKIIESASCITVGTCYCRHKMQHVGKACEKPQDVCLTFNKPAESLAKHKIAKKISKKKAKQILDKSMNLGLVQLGDNVQESVNWICNCCSCCCEGLLAYKRLGYNGKLRSNFVSKHSHEECIGCGVCVKKCPVNSIHLFKHKNGKVYAKVRPERCIGCGVCVRFCPTKSREMERRKETNFVPKDTFERMILQAIDQGKLQNIIFDNQTLWTHTMLRRLLSIIMSLGPSKRILADNQLRSRFMKTMSGSNAYEIFNKLFNNGKGQDYSHPEIK